MLARHAEAMFWAGRYLERTEDTARMLQATFQSSASVGPDMAAVRYRNLLRTLRFDVPPGPIAHSALIDRLVLDRDAPGSILNSVGFTRQNLRSVREQIPSELWEHTNRLHLWLRQPEFAPDLEREPYRTLDGIKERCQTLAGIINTAMAREEGHQFLALGQTIERALMGCRLVYVRYPELSRSSYDETALTLRSASALEAYQRAFRSSSDPVDVARFLLVRDRFPRSVLFCLRTAHDQLAALGATTGTSLAVRIIGQLRSQLEFAEFRELAENLEPTLRELEDGIRHAANAVATQYFRNAEELDLHSQLLLPGGAV